MCFNKNKKYKKNTQSLCMACKVQLPNYLAYAMTKRHFHPAGKGALDLFQTFMDCKCKISLKSDINFDSFVDIIVTKSCFLNPLQWKL